jgi:carbamate kinase
MIKDISRPYPFDVLGTQTQGKIGYWLVQALQNALPGRQAACLVSLTIDRSK